MAFGVSKEELQKALQELRRACDAEIKSAEEYKRAAEIYKCNGWNVIRIGNKSKMDERGDEE